MSSSGGRWKREVKCHLTTKSTVMPESEVNSRWVDHQEVTFCTLINVSDALDKALLSLCQEAILPSGRAMAELIIIRQWFWQTLWVRANMLGHLGGFWNYCLKCFWCLNQNLTESWLASWLFLHKRKFLLSVHLQGQRYFLSPSPSPKKVFFWLRTRYRSL